MSDYSIDHVVGCTVNMTYPGATLTYLRNAGCVCPVKHPSRIKPCLDITVDGEERPTQNPSPPS